MISGYSLVVQYSFSTDSVQTQYRLNNRKMKKIAYENKYETCEGEDSRLYL